MPIDETFDDHEVDAALAEKRTRAAARSTWVSVAVNVLLAAIQVVTGLFSHSQGLVADGIHSLSDLFSDFIVLFAGHHSRKEADDNHPYGHHRFETAASLALGLLLLGVGVGMIWAGVQRLQDPDLIPRVDQLALGVAVAALVAKEGLFRYMLTMAKRVKSSLLVANAWHARSDAASSLVVGLGILGNLAGYPTLDPVAALIVGFMIARMGFGFGWSALQDLMDESADAEEVEAIRRTLAASPGVLNVHDLRTRKMGDMIIVDAHIEVDAQITVEAGHDIAVEAQSRVLKNHRVLRLMTHVDPHHRPDLDHEPVRPPAAGDASRAHGP